MLRHWNSFGLHVSLDVAGIKIGGRGDCEDAIALKHVKVDANVTIVEIWAHFISATGLPHRLFLVNQSRLPFLPPGHKNGLPRKTH